MDPPDAGLGAGWWQASTTGTAGRSIAPSLSLTEQRLPTGVPTPQPCRPKPTEPAMSQSHTTRDHDTIRTWAEARDGHPAKVDTGGKGGILRIDFGEPEENLTRIDWDEFFRIFDDNGLEFLYQDKTAGGDTSRFNKFVSGK
jgi:hypothetical protein